MHVFRICRRAFRALDGEGARRWGGRWNSPGRPVVYTSSTLSLAALEYLVHLDPADAPRDLVAMTIEIPDRAAIDIVDPSSLPAKWAQVPEHRACVERGDAWLREGRSLALRVPSAPVPEETNVLVDPRHAAASEVSVVAERPFRFDPRLIG